MGVTVIRSFVKSLVPVYKGNDRNIFYLCQHHAYKYYKNSLIADNKEEIKVPFLIYRFSYVLVENIAKCDILII